MSEDTIWDNSQGPSRRNSPAPQRPDDKKASSPKSPDPDIGFVPEYTRKLTEEELSKKKASFVCPMYLV